MAGKPDALVRPQSAIVEMSNLGQRIKAPAMSVAGEVIQFFQFAKDGEIGIRAEDALQFRQIGDLVAAKMLTQHRGIERSGSHNVIVHIPIKE
jgi:hypothetical protein